MPGAAAGDAAAATTRTTRVNQNRRHQNRRFRPSPCCRLRHRHGCHGHHHRHHHSHHHCQQNNNITAMTVITNSCISTSSSCPGLGCVGKCQTNEVAARLRLIRACGDSSAGFVCQVMYVPLVGILQHSSAMSALRLMQAAQPPRLRMCRDLMQTPWLKRQLAITGIWKFKVLVRLKVTIARVYAPTGDKARRPVHVREP